MTRRSYLSEGNPNFRHGMAGSNIYAIWVTLYQRCNNINNKKYKNYGGRGIKCLWKSFEEFHKDMGPIYKKGLSIDRIDNNGNYCKENCRRINIGDQANNKTTTHRIIYEGEKYSMMQISKKLGINYSRIRSRLNRGRPIEKALSLDKYDAGGNIIF